VSTSRLWKEEGPFWGWGRAVYEKEPFSPDAIGASCVTCAVGRAVYGMERSCVWLGKSRGVRARHAVPTRARKALSPGRHQVLRGHQRYHRILSRVTSVDKCDYRGTSLIRNTHPHRITKHQVLPGHQRDNPVLILSKCDYRGTSLIRNCPGRYRGTSRKRTPLGLYSRTMPRVLGGS